LEFKLEEQGVLRGTVVVGHGGKPAASAKITVYVVHAHGTWVTRTMNVADPKGTFSIRGLSPAKYEFEASTSAGLLSSRVPFEIREGEEPAPVTITLNPGASISGTILTPEGMPAKGARLRAVPQLTGGVRSNQVYAQVDAEGRFLIRPVRPGDYILYATHARWSPAQELVSVSEGSDINVTINLLMGGSVRLAVRDLDGRPVVGATVHLRNSSGGTVNIDWNRHRQEYSDLRRADPGLDWGEFYRLLSTTDSRGVFERRFLAPDEYTLNVRAGGFRPGKVSALVREGRVTTQVISL
ncbi:MAG: carboxypeptidase regulatory-like domain-containing protein, partial [Phycisphaeraceae bacterium]|nr:carboxypeptidase regulatory-like domain-containing protein [Phycisphaeraceae bacterium]